MRVFALSEIVPAAITLAALENTAAYPVMPTSPLRNLAMRRRKNLPNTAKEQNCQSSPATIHFLSSDLKKKRDDDVVGEGYFSFKKHPQKMSHFLGATLDSYLPTVLHLTYKSSTQSSGTPWHACWPGEATIVNCSTWVQQILSLPFCQPQKHRWCWWNELTVQNESITLRSNPLNIFESVLVSLVHPNITSITSICSSPFFGQRNIMPLTAKHSSGSCGKKRPLWSYPKTSKSWNHEAPNSTVTRWGDFTLAVLWRISWSILVIFILQPTKKRRTIWVKSQQSLGKG